MDMGDLGRRRSVRSGASVIGSGSVWESRMKVDEVKGGIKVFNGDDNVGEKESGTGSVRRSSIGVSSRRKTWRSESNFGGFERSKTSPVQVSKVRSDSQLPSSSDTEKSPVPVQGRRKLRSERSKELGRSLSLSGSVDDGIGSPIRGRRKLRSDSVSDGVGVQSRMEKPEPEPEEGRNEAVYEPEKSCGSGGDEIENSGSDPVEEMENEFGLCQEKAISCNNASPVDDCAIAEEDDDDNEEMEVEDDEFEVIEGVEEEEKKNIDIKEMDVPEPEHNPEKVVLVDNEEEEEEKPEKVVMAENEEEEEEDEEEEKPKKVVIEEKKFIHNLNTKPATMASTVRRQPPPPSPVMRRSRIYQNLYHQQQQQQQKPTKPTPPPDQFKRFPHTQSKLQSLVDLVMWRDVSRSAFVFGVGTFVIISSSYTQDLNISFISVVSYLGLVYLASIFLYKSIICRGVIDNEASYVVGEGEAVWLIKLFLPYLNEFLLKLRALFSGDPCTTMKLAVLLFVLARCGSSITIWKMAKFGFFGAFTVPKVCSSYSSQITAYGKFWIRRFEDAWESCTHKKAVAIGIFTLVWNLSSIVARVWAVFMVCVGIRYYQQAMMVRDDWVEEEEDDDGDAVAAEEGEEASTCSQNGGSRGRHGHGFGPTIVELSKAKKGS